LACLRLLLAQALFSSCRFIFFLYLPRACVPASTLSLRPHTQ
jgi:hypothetical protein